MILKFLKRIFGRDENKAAIPAAVASADSNGRRGPEKDRPMASDIEVASLSLRAILEKLPQDLRSIVEKMPEPEAKIMLPLNSIVKQLPSGAVRMSLASLLRQAPAGTFRKADVEGKQMVDVPLSEVFKNIDPRRLHRRTDQRRYDVPENDEGLFGRANSGHGLNGGTSAAPEPDRTEVAPAAGMHAHPTPTPTPPPPARPAVLKMPGLNPSGAPASIASQPNPTGANGELVISFAELAAGWPEGIRSELSCVPGETKLVIPQQAVSPGLQKGKVIFPWAQIRKWMTPSFHAATGIADELDLVLPLKIVAPAFVAATGATKRREATEIDQTLPDFFGAVPKPAFKLEQAPPTEAPVPKAFAAAIQAEHAASAAAHAEAPAAPEPAHLPEPPAPSAPAVLSLVTEPAAHEPAPAPEAPPPAPVPVLPPASTPAQLVKQACSLEGIAGALVALEEGLVVAQKLPEGFCADAFSAFMPQIIARLGKYTTEMKLGEATEVTIHTSSGLCHVARSGKIYFGTLGHVGAPLPAGLQALTAQLAALNS